MKNFPKKTLIDRRVTKEKFVSSIKPTSEEEKLLTDEVQKIVWKYCFSNETLNISKGARVQELHFFELHLKLCGVSDALLRYLSRSPKPVIFILRYGDDCCLAAFAHGRVYRLAWSNEEPEPEIKGLTLDEVYDNLLSYISGIDFDGIDFETAAEKTAMREKLQKKLIILEKKARAETQPSAQLKLLAEIEKLKKDIGEKFA